MKGQATKPHRQRRSTQQLQQEREEIREYLTKLRQIVPACPKDGKISRVDLIQHVIDYILQLQTTLVNHSVNKIDPIENLPATPPTSPHHYPTLVNPRIVNNSCLTLTTQSEIAQLTSKQSRAVRRPLGLLASLNQRNHI